MTLSLLQMQSFNYFAIIYSFNTLTDFVKNLLCIFDWNSFFFFFFFNHDIRGERAIKINVLSVLWKLYYEDASTDLDGYFWKELINSNGRQENQEKCVSELSRYAWVPSLLLSTDRTTTT